MWEVTNYFLLRVFNVCKTWASKYWPDLEICLQDKPFATKFVDFITVDMMQVTNLKKHAETIKQKLQEKVKEKISAHLTTTTLSHTPHHNRPSQKQKERNSRFLNLSLPLCHHKREPIFSHSNLRI